MSRPWGWKPSYHNSKNEIDENSCFVFHTRRGFFTLVSVRRRLLDWSCGQDGRLQNSFFYLFFFSVYIFSSELATGSSDRIAHGSRTRPRYRTTPHTVHDRIKLSSFTEKIIREFFFFRARISILLFFTFTSKNNTYDGDWTCIKLRESVCIILDFN